MSAITTATRAQALVLIVTAANAAELDHLAEYTSLRCLDCSNLGLTHLPPLPETLQILVCSGNKLTQLPMLPAALQTLECNNKTLGHNNNPFVFDIYTKSIEEIRKWQSRASFTELTITKDNIGELEHLSEYTSLTMLDCSNNQLTQLPDVLPDTLQQLGCDNNQLTHLPEVLPATLRELDCYNNPFDDEIASKSIEEIRQWQLENPRYFAPVFK